jgi:hypothetical protein
MNFDHIYMDFTLTTNLCPEEALQGELSNQPHVTDEESGTQ